MERVKKGEEYWYLSGVHNVERGWDNYGSAANLDFVNNNYFHTKEEAESMARKLRAVLKGAEVIEMPSGQDITKQYAAMIVKHKEYDLYTSAQVHISVIDWLKSKIIK